MAAPQQFSRARVDPIPGYLPGNEPHVLSGASGAGKTTLVALMLQSMARGEKFLGHETQRPPAIAVVLGDRTARDTLEKFGRRGLRHGQEVFVYSLADDLTAEGRLLVEQVDKAHPASNPFPVLTRAEQLLRVQRGVAKDQPALPPGTLLVIDGMAPVLGIEPAGKFLRDVAKPLLRFSQWLLDRGITAILIHQQGKAKGDSKQRFARKQDAILGSMALHAGTGTQMALLEPELTGHNCHEFLWVPHGAPKQLVKLKRGDDGQFEQVRSLVGDAADAELAGDMEGIDQELRNMLELVSYQGTSVMELVAKGDALWSWSRSKTYRMLSELKELGKVTSDDRGRWQRRVVKGVSA